METIMMVGWCVFAKVVVMLVPCEGSETYVNGKRVEDAIQLRSGTWDSLMTHFLYVDEIVNNL